ncbi:hypothetical protein FACS1894122_11700 [Alphaproteobacteria bacterium]|nr:hypothetical protein FACS1894122_11700 [Alphaproteobacteria bacterium]
MGGPASIIMPSSLRNIERKSGVEKYKTVRKIYDKKFQPFKELLPSEELAKIGYYLYESKGGQVSVPFPSVSFKSLVGEVNGFLGLL